MVTAEFARNAMSRPITTTAAMGAGALMLAVLIGGVVGFMLPQTTTQLVVESGEATLNGAGTGGSFQADSGLTAMLPADVAWVDTPPSAHNFSRPDCLWDGGSRSSRVEAGYTWVETPEGLRYPIVGWLRCP